MAVCVRTSDASEHAHVTGTNLGCTGRSSASLRRTSPAPSRRRLRPTRSSRSTMLSLCLTRRALAIGRCRACRRLGMLGDDRLVCAGADGEIEDQRSAAEEARQVLARAFQPRRRAVNIGRPQADHQPYCLWGPDGWCHVLALAHSVGLRAHTPRFLPSASEESKCQRCPHHGTTMARHSSREMCAMRRDAMGVISARRRAWHCCGPSGR
jgi:hypothetical protein